MLKLTNKFNILHTWSFSQGTLFTLMQNFKLKIRPFLPKKNLKINLLSCYGVYKTLTSYFYNFFKSQESELTIPIAFFLLNTNIKAIFSITSSFPTILCQKSKQDHKHRFFFDSDSFMFHKVLQYFLSSQGGLHEKVWHQLKFSSCHALLFKEFA